MRQLRNTLYILSEDIYLSLDGENVVAARGDEKVGRVPLHTLEGIIDFSYRGASPALMGACVDRGVTLSFFSPRGRFLARVSGGQQGNVLLRRTQYRLADDAGARAELARSFIIGKVFNCRRVLDRSIRDHGLRMDIDEMRKVIEHLTVSIERLTTVADVESVMGIEGDAAARYFSVFGQMILRRDNFSFTVRTRRPPRDPVNAMLSFFYTMLSQDCVSALEGVGLDPCVGFLHSDRPGRPSLALDLMEELRPMVVDRFILTCINNQQVRSGDFAFRETGEVLVEPKARKRLLDLWQQRKKEEIVHPFLKEKIPWGLVPHVQAMLLARGLRGDLDGYPPFLWR